MKIEIWDKELLKFLLEIEVKTGKNIKVLAEELRPMVRQGTIYFIDRNTGKSFRFDYEDKFGIEDLKDVRESLKGTIERLTYG